MAAYFFDSSALVKRYVREAGTDWVRKLTHRRSGHLIFVAGITAVEVTSAIARRRRGGAVTSTQASSILSRFRGHLVGRYLILEMTPDLLADAMSRANRHALRAYDAVQLAAALALDHLNEGGVLLVSADRELNEAAKSEGLVVEDPVHHS